MTRGTLRIVGKITIIFFRTCRRLVECFKYAVTLGYVQVNHSIWSMVWQPGRTSLEGNAITHASWVMNFRISLAPRRYRLPKIGKTRPDLLSNNHRGKKIVPVVWMWVVTRVNNLLAPSAPGLLQCLEVVAGPAVGKKCDEPSLLYSKKPNNKLN